MGPGTGPPRIAFIMRRAIFCSGLCPFSSIFRRIAACFYFPSGFVNRLVTATCTFEGGEFFMGRSLLECRGFLCKTRCGECRYCRQRVAVIQRIFKHERGGQARSLLPPRNSERPAYPRFFLKN